MDKLTDLVCRACGKIICENGKPYEGIVIKEGRSDAECVLCARQAAA